MTTDIAGTREEWRAARAELLDAAASGAAGWLSLTAAPAFAIMALFTGISGDGQSDGLCSAVQGASPLSGMVAMYLLMSALHAAPWLRLIAGRRNAACQS